jgi:integrase
MKTRKSGAINLYEVRPEDAAAHVTGLHVTFSQKTVRDSVKLLNKAFERFLPVGAANPFAGLVGLHSSGDSETVHRKPFTADELQQLLAAARDDAFMFPLVVTAACSGMRRGDVCSLKWADVDLAEGMLAVKTSKTGATVEIPIFAPLRAVLETRSGKRKGYVFPEAAAMIQENADGLSYRFKALVARALDKKPEKGPPENVPPDITPAAEIKAEGMAAVVEHVAEGPRRERILDTLSRYCAGESVRQIEKNTGGFRATVSADLHVVETLIEKRFIRSRQTSSIRRAIERVTREKRRRGLRAASVRDWHALRTTWVTLALTAGVPMELVRRVTGHATVEVVMKHYFRPDREQFKAALMGALPAVLTGGKVALMKPADELAALAGKVAAGTADENDKKRLRLLAAKV